VEGAEDDVGGDGAVGDAEGDVAEALLGGSGMAAEQLEGPFHFQLAALGEDALGLLDDDSAVQGHL
jgi:hypothetical protein